eukprot:PhF_6_TR32150/c1_g1_i2/m.47646
MATFPALHMKLTPCINSTLRKRGQTQKLVTYRKRPHHHPIVAHTTKVGTFKSYCQNCPNANKDFTRGSMSCLTYTTKQSQHNTSFQTMRNPLLPIMKTGRIIMVLTNTSKAVLQHCHP